ncbi:hypothetical protein VN97_g629 [Penicillium thymicola]|uniref:Uncharacterized protein n=1 Tax=Penicillium thymicola TaxID=293382 RepID=A0AAI9TT29_PENTH|nr:hypothetical protein VN97_g629 [Penicillium thymicola]
MNDLSLRNRAKRPIHLPGIGAPQQIQDFHQMQNLEIRYLLYDLPVQKVLRHPVGITYIFSALELARRHAATADGSNALFVVSDHEEEKRVTKGRLVKEKSLLWMIHPRGIRAIPAINPHWRVGTLETKQTKKAMEAQYVIDSLLPTTFSTLE